MHIFLFKPTVRNKPIKLILPTLFILFTLIVFIPIVAFGSDAEGPPRQTPTYIVVDHNSVALFEQIPEEYLQAAAALNMFYMDRSVGSNINDGLTCLGYPSDEDAPIGCRRLEHRDPTFSVSPSEIDWSRPGGYDRSNWDFQFWPVGCDIWHEAVECYLDIVDPIIHQYDIVSYQFSYLEVKSGDTIADQPGGFFWDNSNLYDVYDLEAYEAQHPDKTFIYWTTSLARSIGTTESEAFNDQMRQYASANGKILFDVADILSHDPGGNPCYDNRDGVPYDDGVQYEDHPDDGLNLSAICQHYTTEANGGHLGSVSVGKIRVAKAFWVLMAQIAGWDSGVTPTPSPTPSPTPPPNGETTWFLAEGFTSAGFSTFILLQNPNPDPANVTVTYMLDDGSNITRSHTVAANSRYTIAAHDAAEVGPDQAFATRIDSDQPVIVERAMYFADGGHNTIGLTGSDTTWFLAEGFTGAGFSTFILLQNPNPDPANVTVTYMLDDGSNITRSHTVAANSRYTIAAHDAAEVGPDQAFATHIDSDQPVIVERAMYWADGGHNTIGLTGSNTTWFLAEGFTGAGFNTFILLQNPNPDPANVTVTYMLDDGSNITHSHTVAANSRYTIAAHDAAEVGPDQAFATRIDSDQPVIVERAMYWADGGHNTIGLTGSNTTWFLAEGFTGAGFSTFILLQNPNPDPANVTVTYMLDDGSNITRSHTVAANSRYTIAAHDAAEVGPDQAFATRIDSDQPVIVERAMYWADGGHNTIGIQP